MISSRALRVPRSLTASQGFEKLRRTSRCIVLAEVGLYAFGVFTVDGILQYFLDGFSDRFGRGTLLSQVDAGS